MIAIGADQGGFHHLAPIVRRGPLKSRFEHNLFGRLALRLIEKCGWLGQAKNIAHPVVTDAIAGTKFLVGVIVERAPPETTGILRTAGEGVVDSRVSPNMLSQPFAAVVHFGW